MASELNQFLENVDEKVLECTICFKRLQNPKSLNCLHSFCLACLEDWVKAKGKLTCPNCSKSYSIPEGGLQKLPPNTFLNNLLETIEQFSRTDKMKCACKKGKATYYCQDCRQYLCSTCIKNHEDFQLFEKHKLHSVEDVQSMSPSQMTLLHPPQCSLHGKHLEFYCTECKTPICMHCTITEHNAWEGNHKPISISTAFKQFKKTSETLKKSANDCKSKLQNGIKAVTQIAIKLDQSKENTLRDIDNHVQLVIKKINENGEKIKKEVEKIYKKKKKVNDLQMDELKTTLSDIKIKLSFLNKLLESDEGTAMQSSEKVVAALKDRISKLPKTEPDDNGQIKFFIDKKQFAAHEQFDIGNTEITVKTYQHMTPLPNSQVERKQLNDDIHQVRKVVSKNRRPHVFRAPKSQPMQPQCENPPDFGAVYQRPEDYYPHAMGGYQPIAHPNSQLPIMHICPVCQLNCPDIKTLQIHVMECIN